MAKISVKARIKTAVANSKTGTKTTGTYKGKSNELGKDGRAQQLLDKGVPPGVVGNIARAKGAAKGGPNYKGK